MTFQVLVRAEKLPVKWHRKPNTYAVVSDILDIGSVMGLRRKPYGKTEVVTQTSSPEWAHVFLIDHTPETDHKLAIDIFDTTEFQEADTASSITDAKPAGITRGVSNDDKNATQLCGIIVDVEAILSSRDQTITELIPGAGKGKIHVKLEKSMPGSQKIRFQFRGYGLTNTRLALLNLDRPDFYLEIRRKQKGVTQNTFGLVYRSECSRGTVHPLWQHHTIDLRKLCNNDFDREMRISILDKESSGKKTRLGSCETTVNGLIENRAVRGNCDRSKAFKLSRIDDMKKKKKRGELLVIQAEILTNPQEQHTLFLNPQRLSVPFATTSTAPITIAHPQAVHILPPPIALDAQKQSNTQTQYTFEDFIAARYCQLEMCVAIDFTSSNGDFRMPGTPHHQTVGITNTYQWVSSVMALAISQFNPVQEYPVWGFGAAYNKRLYNIFQCGRSPLAQGGEGIVDAYRNVLKTDLVFQSQTVYDDVIQAAASHSAMALSKAQQQQRLAYTLLVILTTGTEKDVLATKQTIEKVSTAPLSIVFIRIENEQSTTFDGAKLDAHLTSNGCRSFCTFIEARNFYNPRNSQALAQATVSRLKEQLPNYFLLNGIYPAK